MDGRRNLGIGSNEWSWCVYVPFDTFGYWKFAKKCPKAVIFQNMGIYEIVNTLFESGDGWGLFVIHKYFLV